MKKAIALTLILFSAAACCGNRQAAVETTTTETTETLQAPEHEKMSGAYTDPRALNDQEKTLFANATEGLVGVIYTPRSVATQVVAGINYRFICTATPTSSDPKAYDAEVVIYQPLPHTQEAPRITKIEHIAQVE